MYWRNIVVSILMIIGIGIYTVNTSPVIITEYSIFVPLLSIVSVVCTTMITFTPTMYNTMLKFSGILLSIFILVTCLDFHYKSEWGFKITTIWGILFISIDTFKYYVFMIAIFVMLLPLILNLILSITIYYGLLFILWILCNNILNLEINNFDNIRAGMLYIVGYMMYNLILNIQKLRIGLFVLLVFISIICFIISQYHIEIPQLETSMIHILTTIYELITIDKFNIKNTTK